MSNVRYFDYSQNDADQASFSPEQLELLDSINRKVGGRESLPDVLDYLADALHGFAPCDRFSLAFIEEDGRRVTSHHTRAFYEHTKLNPGYAEDISGSSLEETIERGVPRVIYDLKQYLIDHPHSRSTKILVSEGVRSNLTCPLVVDGRTVGLLFRSSRTPAAYDEQQVLLQLALSDRLSQTVEKTRRIEQLAEANRQYFEMLGFVVHELKSPIGTMLMEAGLLTDGYMGDLDPRQKSTIEKMVAKGHYLLSLIDDYLDLSRLEGGKMTARMEKGVDLHASVLEPAVEIVEASLSEKRMNLVRDIPSEIPLVELDPSLIKIVVVNLLSNAVKYGREGGEVRLAVTTDGSSLRVSVRNEGEGFLLEQRNQLFKKFSRLQTPALLKQKGTGVGLYTSWRIARMHGGRMDAESEHGKWAEFTLAIPQPPRPEMH